MASTEPEEAICGAPSGPANRCVCGSLLVTGIVGAQVVRLCHGGDHVTVGDRTYIYVENPGDVIEVVAHCWLCGGVDPNETVTVAREHPNGPKCPAYKTKVHTGCWQDMSP